MMRNRSVKNWVIVVTLLALMNTAKAEDTYWVGTTGDWFSPANWQYKVPDLGDVAYIDKAGTAQISSGSAEAGMLYVGDPGPTSAGYVEQSSGDATFNTIRIPMGEYKLLGGTLQSSNEQLLYASTSKFSQSGGINTTSQLRIFSGSPVYDHSAGTNNAATLIMQAGTYNLSGTAQLNSSNQTVSQKGTCLFNQTGGTNYTGNLNVGVLGYTGANGTYYQSGGINNISGTIVLGDEYTSQGTYTISGGEMNAQEIKVAFQGTGTFNINNSSSSITISDNLFFGGDSIFTAVADSIIHMEGSLDNWNTDETDLAGFNNLSLIFEGGSTGTFEVGGLINGGFDDNFALAALNVSDSFNLQLVDWRDNGNGSDECLFTDTLDIEFGSALDTNRLLLYVNGNVESLLDGWIADGRLVALDAVYDSGNNWTVTEPVPEPATILLVGLGGILLRKRSN